MSPGRRRLALAAALLTVAFPARSEIEFSGSPLLEADVVTVPRAEYAPSYSTFHDSSYSPHVGITVGASLFFVMEDETHGAEPGRRTERRRGRRW
jgi:hypothetical protein